MPTNQSFIPLVRLPGYDVLLVQELIDADNASWNMDKLEENFFFEPIDVASICTILIGRFSEDEWAWEYEKSGKFTVRSDYKLRAASRIQFEYFCHRMLTRHWFGRNRAGCIYHQKYALCGGESSIVMSHAERF
jgi:hypothetical protein